MVFGLARTGQSGARAIESRVRAEIERHPRLHRSGFEVNVTSYCFEVAVVKAAEMALAQTTRHLETQMRTLEEGGY